MTSESFVNDFINSLRDKRIEGFKQRYRNYDLLLIDDVQFFEGKERFQEEFFHTFNTLYEAGSQIVLSSDRPPQGDRDARGAPAVTVRVGPDHRHPAARPRDAHRDPAQEGEDGRRSTSPDPQLLTFIAGRISTNIRELEGALTRVVAFSSLTGRPMTAELAQDVLKDVFPQGEVAAGDDRADPGGRLRAVQHDARGALQPQALPEHRLPAPGGDVPLARAHRLVAAEDRQALRRPRPHHRPAREHEDPNMIRADRTVYNLVQELTARIKQVR